MTFPMTQRTYVDIKAHVCTEYTDMRNSIDGLVSLVKPLFKMEPTNGHLFLFMNEARNRIKLLIWHNGGFWLLYKRLDQGKFPEPALLANKGMSIRELMGLIDSAHKNFVVRRPQFEPVVA